MAIKRQSHEAFLLGRRYFKMLQNLLGLQRNGLLNEQESRLMELELKRAKTEYERTI